MVSNYENGRRTYSDTMARRLSTVLHVKEDHLKYGSESEPRHQLSSATPGPGVASAAARASR